MKAPFFVEMLSRGKDVRRRQRVESLPIRIGRAYDNDVILDDPHTSAHHAVIELNNAGGLLVRDLGSNNGIIHKIKRQKELAIDGNTIFRLGHTHLRVRSIDFPVDDELADTTFHRWEGWPPALAGLFLLVCLTLVTTWLKDTKMEGPSYISDTVFAISFSMIWCGLWAFANRLFGGSTRLGRHLFILGCGVVSVNLWNLISAAIAYAFSWETLTSYGSHVIILLLSIMVYFHLLHISPRGKRIFAAIAGGFALLSSVLVLMSNYHSHRRLGDDLYMQNRFPPAVRVTSDKTVAQFMGDAASLRAKADEGRAKAAVGDEVNDEDDD